MIDQPTDLPEGLVLELVVDDEGDELTDAERRHLHQVLTERWRSAQAGHVVDAAEVTRRLAERSARIA
jgi:hypothetical protein